VSAASAASAGERRAGESGEHVGGHQHQTSNGPMPPVPPYGVAGRSKEPTTRPTVSGNGKVGGVLALQDATRPFPVQADVKVGDMHIALVGTVTDPAQPHRARPAAVAAGRPAWRIFNPAHRFAATRNAALTRPKDGLSASSRPEGNVFKYANFTGRVGESDVNGFRGVRGQKTAAVRVGELVSHLLAILRFSRRSSAPTPTRARRKRGEHKQAALGQGAAD